MKRYRKQKTTMGHKYYLRMPDDEISERSLFRISIVVLPFFGTALLFAVWLLRG